MNIFIRHRLKPIPVPLHSTSPPFGSGGSGLKFSTGSFGSPQICGTPASPLRKALIESGLGEDLAMAGLDPQLKQLTFSVGLRGIAPEDADSFEKLTFDTLREIAEKGPEPALVEAGTDSLPPPLRRNEAAVDSELVWLPRLREGVPLTEAVRSRKSSSPTAIFATNNFIAFGAIRALKEAGIRVPDDMSVVAFDASAVFTALPARVSHRSQIAIAMS